MTKHTILTVRLELRFCSYRHLATSAFDHTSLVRTMYETHHRQSEMHIACLSILSVGLHSHMESKQFGKQDILPQLTHLHTSATAKLSDPSHLHQPM